MLTREARSRRDHRIERIGPLADAILAQAPAAVREAARQDEYSQIRALRSGLFMATWAECLKSFSWTSTQAEARRIHKVLGTSTPIFQDL